MKYNEVVLKHRKEVEDFPMFFAFNEEQFAQGLASLGAEKEEIATTGAGGYIRKADAKAYVEMGLKQIAEMQECYKNEEFLLDAIVYELGNHEFCITYDKTDTIDALGLDMENEFHVKALEKAIALYLEQDFD